MSPKMQLLASAAVASLLTVATATPGYVHFDVEKRTPSVQTLNRLARRQYSSSSPIYTEIEQNLSNHLEYIINVTIGTPGQHMGVTLDTGSSDLWVPSRSFCSQRNADCDYGDYDPSASSTYNLLEQGQFNITYAGPGDSDAGDWATDTVSVGGAKGITEQIIGVSNAGADQHGVMGIGFDTNEAQPNPSSNGVYKSVLDNMVDQGIISRRAYSVYLNSLNETYGSIIFGGIDTTKYTGELVALPLQPSTSQSTDVSEFFVTLSSVAFTDANGNTQTLTPEGYAQSTLLDTGTSDILLSNDVWEKVVGGLGVVTPDEQSYLVPCGYANSNASFSFTFGGTNGVTVNVPLSELVGNKADNDCSLGMGPIIQGTSIMGDTFLRSAYVVLDIDNKLAAIAQAVDNKASTSDIQAIPSGTNFPGVSSTATATGTQLAGIAATSVAPVPSASIHHSSVAPGTATFSLGTAATAAATGSSSSNIAMRPTSVPQAALIGGLIAGALIL